MSTKAELLLNFSLVFTGSKNPQILKDTLIRTIADYSGIGVQKMERKIPITLPSVSIPVDPKSHHRSIMITLPTHQRDPFVCVIRSHPKPSSCPKRGFGNTQVTCHVGVPSCGQRHRNTFPMILVYLDCTRRQDLSHNVVYTLRSLVIKIPSTETVHPLESFPGQNSQR